MLFPSNLNVYRTMEETRAHGPSLPKYSLSYLVPTKGKHNTETGYFESRGMEVSEFRDSMVQIHYQTQRLVGAKTSGCFPQWSFGHNLNEYDLDEAYALGVNAVRTVAGMGPVVWGHSLKDSKVTVSDAVVGNDLLIAMVRACKRGKSYNLEYEANQVAHLVNHAIQDLVCKGTLRSGSCTVYHDQGYPWLKLTFELFFSIYEFDIRPGVEYAVASGPNAAELLRALAVLYPNVCKYDESKRYVQINGYWIGIY